MIFAQNYEHRFIQLCINRWLSSYDSGRMFVQDWGTCHSHILPNDRQLSALRFTVSRCLGDGLACQLLRKRQIWLFKSNTTCVWRTSRQTTLGLAGTCKQVSPSGQNMQIVLPLTLIQSDIIIIIWQWMSILHSMQTWTDWSVCRLLYESWVSNCLVCVPQRLNPCLQY